VDKSAKSPVFQAGHRGFESRHRYQYHWPEAHQDEQAILNRQAASSILAGPTKSAFSGQLSAVSHTLQSAAFLLIAER
jgi:hypothetical protein